MNGKKMIGIYEKPRSRVLTHAILQCQICFYIDALHLVSAPTIVYLAAVCYLLNKMLNRSCSVTQNVPDLQPENGCQPSEVSF